MNFCFLVNLTIAGIWYNIQDASRGRKNNHWNWNFFCGISAFLERIHGEREWLERESCHVLLMYFVIVRMNNK